jgi:shikimate kinase
MNKWQMLRLRGGSLMKLHISMTEFFSNRGDWNFFYRKIETSTISDYSSQFRDVNSPGGGTIKPFVAMAPCGGPLGK